jgi:predicted GNAT superfamily acetyltransferase
MALPSKEYLIRRLTTIDEMCPLENLQRVVWKYSDLDITPARHFYIDAMMGGIVLGAYKRNELIGFCSGAPAIDKRTLYLFSKLLAVSPDHQGRGIGVALKQHQMTEAKAEGFNRISWTFDPLQPRNGFLNFHELGAVSSHFQKNMYGVLQGSQNLSLPSDRLRVDWYADKPRAQRTAESARPINSINNDLTSTVIDTTRTDQLLLLAIPKNFSDIRKNTPALALAWQGAVRKAFETYLSSHMIVDALKTETSFHYVLQRK